MQSCNYLRHQSRSQKNMTTQKQTDQEETCPAQGLIKLLSGKWKPEIFRLSLNGPLRFNALLRDLEGSNKQSIALALKELEQAQILSKKTIQEKPLHIEYTLTEKGKALIPVFEQLEGLSTPS